MKGKVGAREYEGEGGSRKNVLILTNLCSVGSLVLTWRDIQKEDTPPSTST